MQQISHADIPEQGQLVEVRHRRYIVSEITRSTMPSSTLPEANGNGQTLVSLTSMTAGFCSGRFCREWLMVVLVEIW